MATSLEELQTVVSVDGEVSTLEKAVVPFSDRGFLFGQGIFETLLVSSNAIVGWNEHMARLMKGADRILLTPPSPVELQKGVIQTVKAFHKINGLDPQRAQEISLQIRLILTGNSGSNLALPVVRDSKGQPLKCRVSLVCRPAVVKPAKYDQVGLALFPVFDSRSVAFLETKSTNYLWNMMALEEALAQGCDDALFFNDKGIFTECTTSNFLWINAEDKICGAPIKNNCLPGTSLLSLVRGLIKKGHQFHEDPLPAKNPGQASACFVISSVRGLTPVGRIGEHQFEVSDYSETKDYLNSILFAEQKTGLIPIYE